MRAFRSRAERAQLLGKLSRSVPMKARRASGKSTLPSLRGIGWTQTRLTELITEAQALLAPYGERADMLVALAAYVATREK